MNFQSVLLILGSLLVGQGQVDAVQGAGGAEIQVISNTNLLTGVYYRIGLPNYFFSTLSWAGRAVPDRPDDRFVMLDDREVSAVNYEKNGKWYRDGLWYFKPSETSGYYTMHGWNGAEKILSTSSVMVSPEATAPADYYAFLTGPENIGQNYSLWEFLPANGINEYQIRNYGVPGLAATTFRFGSYIRYIRINLQTDVEHESFGEADLTGFKFKAIGVEL